MSFVSDTEYKARKNHRCCACCEVISQGFRYVVSFCTYDGRGFSDKWHTECRVEFGRMLKENMEDEGNPRQTWEGGLPEEIKRKYGIESESLEQWKDNENKKGYV